MTGFREHSYPALDGMRGVAAIAILLLHFPPFGQTPWFRNGLLAVDAFFVMSGFVIAAAYDRRLTAGLGARRFLLARYIRLWPALALGVAAGLVQALVAPMASKDLPMDVAARIGCAGFGLVLLPCPLPSPQFFPTDPPEWSLFYELVANLLFALAFAPLLKAGRMIALIAGFACVVVVGIVHYHGVWFGDILRSVPFQLGRVGFSFFLGVGLHRTERLWAPRLPRLSAWMVYLLLAIVLAAPTPRGLQTPVHLLGVLIVCPLLIALGARARPQGWLKDASAWLGALSYPLYALHHPLLFLGRGLSGHRLDTPSPADVPLILAVLGLALALPAIYEGPVRRWLTARLGGRASAGVAGLPHPAASTPEAL